MASLAPSPADELDLLCGRYVDAQLAGDRKEALRLVMEDGLRRGHAVAALQSRVVQAAQRRIGQLWAQNRISVAEEHMATAISQVVMSRLFEEAAFAPRTGRKIVVACVEGELHEFPARLVSDFLEMGGYDVRYLGANVPTDHLMRLVADEAPHLLCLSVTMSFNAPSLRKTAMRARLAFPGLPILVGGHALEWEPQLARTLGVHSCDASAQCVLEAAARLTGQRA